MGEFLVSLQNRKCRDLILVLPNFAKSMSISNKMIIDFHILICDLELEDENNPITSIEQEQEDHLLYGDDSLLDESFDALSSDAS